MKFFMYFSALFLGYSFAVNNIIGIIYMTMVLGITYLVNMVEDHENS